MSREQLEAGDVVQILESCDSQSVVGCFAVVTECRQNPFSAHLVLPRRYFVEPTRLRPIVLSREHVAYVGEAHLYRTDRPELKKEPEPAQAPNAIAQEGQEPVVPA